MFLFRLEVEILQLFFLFKEVAVMRVIPRFSVTRLSRYYAVVLLDRQTCFFVTIYIMIWVNSYQHIYMKL